jgi:hypothetical protein
MNSLVLNPCRWVVFFTVIPCATPWPPGLGPIGFVTEAPRRLPARETFEALRRAAEDTLMLFLEL